MDLHSRQYKRKYAKCAIRKSVARQLPSMTFDRVRSIFVGLTRQVYPVGCLEMLRRELEESLA